MTLLRKWLLYYGVLLAIFATLYLLRKFGPFGLIGIVTYIGLLIALAVAAVVVRWAISKHREAPIEPRSSEEACEDLARRILDRK